MKIFDAEEVGSVKYANWLVMLDTISKLTKERT